MRFKLTPPHDEPSLVHVARWTRGEEPYFK